MGQKYKTENVIGAIRKSRGLIALAARELGCPRSTIYRYIDRHPTVKKAVEEERDSLIDLAEQKLFEHVENGNLPAIMFVLKTIGKDRGYWEQRGEQKPSHFDDTIQVTHIEVVPPVDRQDV